MTKNTHAATGAPTLPLFYKDPVLLRFEDHGDVGLAPPADFGFASEAVVIPLCVGEFVPAMRHYPIVFAADGSASPLVVVGIRQGHNLFVERDGGWRAGTYIPAYVRRYPFIGVETPDKAQQLLTIDRKSNRFVASASARTDAERLFGADGKPTSTAQSAMAFCQAYHADIVNTLAFAKALGEAKLLTPNHVQMQFPDGGQQTLDGFCVVDEKAFRAVPAKTVADWHARGWLDLATLHLASLQNFQSLLGLNAQRADERKALA
jgi:hypothetical protein